MNIPVTHRSKMLTATLAILALTVIFLTLPVYAASGGSEDTDASVTFTAGDLTLNSAPTLDFGSQTISAQEQVYPAVTTGSPIQVGDLRGSGIGWDLIVALSPFTLSDDVTATLQGSSISLANPTVTPANGTIGAPPVAQPTVTLTSDSTQTPVLAAEEDTGMGVWETAWAPGDVELTVLPGTAQQGLNTATLTWSLQSAP